MNFGKIRKPFGGENKMNSLKEFYNGKTVLVTGCTGFKGAWLCMWLKELGANVVGLGLRPRHERDDFITCDLKNKLNHWYGTDILDYEGVSNIVTSRSFDVIFHLAAQALVVPSYKNPYGTFETNIQGTINLLEAIRHSHQGQLMNIVVVTSDKVYKHRNDCYKLRETDTLGGDSPYAASKACVELIVNSYRNSYPGNLRSIVTARAGNVIGGGDWNEYRIVPDIMRAIFTNKVLTLRHPSYVRPWQYVLEPLHGYLKLGKELYYYQNSIAPAWNFGLSPSNEVSVERLVMRFRREIQRHVGRTLVIKEEKEEASNFVENNFLTLDSTLTRRGLNWKPVVSFSRMVKWTIGDYFHTDPYESRVQRIRLYHQLLKKG